MANTKATPNWVTKEVARGYFNSLKLLKNVNRTYSEQYKQAGAKVGNTINARMPARLVVKDGATWQPQDLLDQTVPVSLTNQKQVPFTYTTWEATTELQNIRERYTKPAGQALGSAAEVLAFNAVYRDIYSVVGTLGTTPSATLTFLQAGTKLTDLAAPQDGRVAVLDPLAMQTLANTTSTIFNPTGYISDTTKKGMLNGQLLGVDEWYQDALRPVHTSGTFTASTPLINGASQTGSSMITDGWASGASSLKKGDIFTIGGVNSVNPVAYSSNGRLQQFTVTSDISDTTGAMTIGISPSIITSGQLQTVDAAPADNAVITVWSSTPAGGTLATTTSPQSFIFHPDFMAFVTADLEDQSEAGCLCERVGDKDSGLSLRWIQQYQMGSDQRGSRLDIIVGAATLQARLAARVVG